MSAINVVRYQNADGTDCFWGFMHTKCIYNYASCNFMFCKEECLMRISRLAVLACGATISFGALSGECASKIAIWGNCVPDDLIMTTIDESKQDDFLTAIQQVYDQSVKMFEVKRNPLSDIDVFPGQMLFSVNSGVRSGFFAVHNYQKTREGQVELLTRFCAKHGGALLPSFVMLPPISRQKSNFDLVVDVCSAANGKPLAAIGTRVAKDGRTELENLYAYYFSAPLIESIYDFRKNLKPGDKSQFGMITEVRGNIANIQSNNGNKWIEIDKLVPAQFIGLRL